MNSGYAIDLGIATHGLYSGLTAPNYGIACLGLYGVAYFTGLYAQQRTAIELKTSDPRYPILPEGTVKLVDGRCSDTGKPYHYRRYVFELDKEDMLSETSDKQAACLQKLSVQSSLDFCKYSPAAMECRCTVFEEVTFDAGVE